LNKNTSEIILDKINDLQFDAPSSPIVVEY